jgi:hypothetical protein
LTSRKSWEALDARVQIVGGDDVRPRIAEGGVLVARVDELVAKPFRVPR